MEERAQAARTIQNAFRRRQWRRRFKEALLRGAGIDVGTGDVEDAHVPSLPDGAGSGHERSRGAGILALWSPEDRLRDAVERMRRARAALDRAPAP